MTVVYAEHAVLFYSLRILKLEGEYSMQVTSSSGRSAKILVKLSGAALIFISESCMGLIAILA